MAKIKFSCPPEVHRSPYHLTSGVFHCWGSVLFLVACSNQPPNPISSNRKLLYSRLVRKKYLFPHLYVLAGMSLGDIKTFLLHRLSQAWFSACKVWSENPATNRFGNDYCASFHWLNFFGITQRRANNYLMHDAVFSASGNPWSARPSFRPWKCPHFDISRLHCAQLFC